MPNTTKRGRRPDTVIDDLAARQHGIVAREQLMEAGLPAHIVDYRVRVNRLVSVHRGVYRATPLVGPWAREMAAVLACGPGSLVSHRSAAALWELLPKNPGRPVDVLVRDRRPARIPGIRSRMTDGLQADEMTTEHGIRLTTPLRTIVDLAGVTTLRTLEQTIARADRAGLLNCNDLLSFMGQRRRRPGAPALRALLDPAAKPSMTRSEAEHKLLTLVRHASLPLPEANASVQGFEVDFLWRGRGLIAEVDGFHFHSSRAAFERDRRRDAILTAAGFRVVRFTWQQIEQKPMATVAMLAQALVR
jgi:very-short-patch-repair endonuclease